MKYLMDKKAQAFDLLQSSAIAVIVFVFLLSIGAGILSTNQTTQTTQFGANSLPVNITGEGLTGLTTMSEYTNIIVLVLILVAIVTLFALVKRSAENV